MQKLTDLVNYCDSSCIVMLELRVSRLATVLPWSCAVLSLMILQLLLLEQHDPKLRARRGS